VIIGSSKKADEIHDAKEAQARFEAALTQNTANTTKGQTEK